jgi:mannose-1-phosphate guanylyltransferase
MRHAMIMAGGSGTRLWPISRAERPKQLVPLIGGRSLLAVASDRLEGVVDSDRRWICTGERFRDQVRAAVPSIGDDRILGEPCGRDTLNAVGLTAAVLHRQDPDAIFAVLTADHLIEPQSVFADRLDAGFRLVEEDPTRFVTFAITPTFAATGFGYVERGDAIDGHEGCFHATRFVEKPDVETAEAYLAAGTFGWNSGMFVYHAATVLDTIGRYEPATRTGLDRIANAWNTPERDATLAAIYPELKKISVDYGLMEPASRDEAVSIAVVPMDLSWIDVGSWPSLGETVAADDRGNRITAGTAHTDLDSRNLVVFSDDPDHRICTIGCEDLVIVHTKDATLICRADQAQKVKDMAGIVPESLQ